MAARKKIWVTKRLQVIEFISAESGYGGLIEFTEDSEGTIYVTLHNLDYDVKVQVLRPQ